MTQARPTNPTAIAEADIYDAARQFVLAYTLPLLDPANVVQGWQNRAALPAETNDYAVLSILYNTTHGTTVEIYAPDTETLILQTLVEVVLQVDICAEDDIARLRAQRLAVLARSSVGVQFFNDLGLSILYATDARDLSFVGDANQFVRRYMIELHLVTNPGVTVDLPGALATGISNLYPLTQE